EDLIHLLGVGDLLLEIQILVMSDLLGDQRGEDLPADLHQLVRGEVVLQEPVVRPALMPRRSRRHTGLVLLPSRNSPQNLGRNLAHLGKLDSPEYLGMN